MANVLISKRNTREKKIKYVFLLTVLISMYAQMHQTNGAVSLYKTAVLSILEVSVHWKDKTKQKKLLVKHSSHKVIMKTVKQYVDFTNNYCMWCEGWNVSIFMFSHAEITESYISNTAHGIKTFYLRKCDPRGLGR